MMKDFIQKLPKAELHLHIEGSLEPELMFQLAKRNNIKLPFKSVDEVRQAYQFHDLQSFLNIYYEGAGVLLHEQDFYDLTWAYLLRCQEDNIRHCEIFFDPQTHTTRDVPFKVIVDGISKALKDGHKKLHITSRLIMCFLRHLSLEEAQQTLQQATPYLSLIDGVGLDSSELGHPPSKFQKVFQHAQELGLKLVAHAGEEGPATYIWEAIEMLKVERIDHGVRCLEDEKLVEYLREKRIPLTVCPLSNIKLCVFESMQKHNLRQLMSHGLLVTLNSDDPAYFGGYLAENYLQCQQALNLTGDELKQLAINSFEASFLDDDSKAAIIEEIKQL
jgi:adenine deaminase